MSTQGSPSAPSNTAARTPIQPLRGQFQIGALKEEDRDRWLKALIYGPPGAGKTTLTGSAVDVPQMQDVLVISAEGGTLAMEDNDRIKNDKLIDLVRINDANQLTKLYEFLKVHIPNRDSANELNLAKLQAKVFGLVPETIGTASGDPWPADIVEQVKKAHGRIRYYRTVVIDSLTEIEAQNLSKLQGMDEKGFEVGLVETAGWTEFRQNNHTIQRLIRSFRDLNTNLFVICAQAYSQDELKRFHYTPALTGALKTQVQGFFDVVGYLVHSSAAAEEMGVKDPLTAQTRRLYLQPQAGVKFDAKSRRASYKKPYFNDPTMTSIMEGFGLVKP
jgi:GTPase SAR1 family protein